MTSQFGTLGDLKVHNDKRADKKEQRQQGPTLAAVPSPTASPPSRVKTLRPATSMPKAAEAVAQQEARVQSAEIIVEDMESVAAIIGDDLLWADYQGGMIARFREVKAFLADLTPAERQSLMAAYVRAALEKLPRNNFRSCVVIGTAGLTIGFFEEIDNDPKKISPTRVIHLPVLDEDSHRYDILPMVSNHPRAFGLMGLIRGFEHDVRAQGRQYWHSKIDTMKECDTAKTLAEALRLGKGQVTLKAPDEKIGDWFYAGGWITIVVADSYAQITNALGKCQQKVIDEVIPSEVRIPVSAIPQNRIDVNRFPIEMRRAARIAHGLLHRGFVAEATALRDPSKSDKTPEPVADTSTATTSTTDTSTVTVAPKKTPPKQKRKRSKKPAGEGSSTAEPVSPIAADSGLKQ